MTVKEASVDGGGACDEALTCVVELGAPVVAIRTAWTQIDRMREDGELSCGWVSREVPWIVVRIGVVAMIVHVAVRVDAIGVRAGRGALTNGGLELLVAEPKGDQ